MSFLTPLALIGAAIVGPLIVAMYLLKLRREERTVSPTFLWQRMVRDVEANAPWQKLRYNILLVLQLLLMALLVMALARPFFLTPGIAGRNLIIILDRSASMAATDTDGEEHRLAAAKAQAIRLVDQLPDGGRATVIAAGGQMEVSAAATTDRRELRYAINTIVLNHGGGSDLSQALALAAALAAREEQSEVAILSDGNVTLPEDVHVPATVHYFPIGSSDDNAAVSALALQPSSGGQTLFVQITNYGSKSVTRRLDIYLDGVLFNAYNMTMDAQREQSIVADVPAQVRVVEARLNGEDVLPDDDRAWAVSTLGEAVTVRMIGPGNRFLETAMKLLPGVVMTQVPTTTTTFEETAAQVPVTILDGVVPATLPEGNLLFIAPTRSTEFFSVTSELEFPAMRPAPGDEPLLRNVSLSDVSVWKSARIVPGLWARVVVDSDGGPLLVAGEKDGRRVVVLAFDLHVSDLPLQVAFPLLPSNVIGFLAPGTGAEATQLAPGQPLVLQVDPSITEVRITRPDETQVSTHPGGIFATSPGLTIQNNQLVYDDTDKLGVYTLEELKGDDLQARHRYVVNLFAPSESLVAPQKEVAVTQTSGLQAAVPPEAVGKQEFWRWLAAGALLVLIIEWFVYQRSCITQLWRRWQNRNA